MKQQFCTLKGVEVAKIDPIFTSNRYAALSGNSAATDLMYKLSQMADAAEAELNKAAAIPVGQVAAVGQKGSDLQEAMDLDEIAEEAAEEVAAQQVEALKSDPEGNFDLAKALKASTLKMSAKRAAKPGGVSKNLLGIVKK